MGEAAYVIFKPGGEGFPIIVIVMLAFVGWLGKQIAGFTESGKSALFVQTLVTIIGVGVVLRAAKVLLDAFFATAGYK